ncbi:UDP-N-acetylmuramoyl-L-alanine--D-glutamate ligase [Qipengyuania sp. XHP0207]|uniref:UDP-N-acetylmuramoyl-L-alanine--D-glutamate ligase n=1 Tax=Qipengyuania sp. XHP0207 TaxID=3038078 RepID=UPI00241E96EC|nr:UDP-N-acetylmuramoyl-L-alanine--D-glutamate ligase [Qipengyuania sp. XHP0207]MDG5748973.1 UDP-N-acetylmuramoyl-L-alanine--D-glutamate ligase [Qipengyuania sp. XHP0207]
MIISTAWKDKRYAVLGLARSGRATVEALLASGAEVMAWDSREEARAEFADRVELVDPVEADLSGFAGVVVSPGVPLNTHPIKPHADSFGVPVIGDIELFAQARTELPPHKVVGITGTNGKSTTTALVHHILKTAGVPTTMGGNIGLPILEQEPLPEGGVYVLELSSYQIDLTYSLDCDIAVLLNITPDHLDRYDGDFEAYILSKARLFDMQSADSSAIVGGNVEVHSRISDLFEAGVISHRARSGFSEPDAKSLEQYLPASLSGSHNADNATKAMLACELLGVSERTILKAFASFRGLPHRMERVAEISGVAYVNDSKGTNTAASAPALAAFDNIHWILGGLAKEPKKGESLLGECEAELGHVKAAYTIGQAGPDFATLLEGRVPVEQCETLDHAVTRAASHAVSGDTVLLSPACASFDQYRDFEARGEHFRELVEGLK